MKRFINIFTLTLTIVACISLVETNPTFGSPAIVQDCGCGEPTCRSQSCRLRRPACDTCGQCNTCQQCPKCQTDSCKLATQKGELKKSCFKVEQKIVCIPTVRLPWQKCCPPGSSKTRTVTVLKRHSYKCPNCEYKWSVQEPEVPEQAASVPPQTYQTYETYAPDQTHSEVAPAAPAASQDQFMQQPESLPFEQSQPIPAGQPAFEQVPSPPSSSGWQPQSNQ